MLLEDCEGRPPNDDIDAFVSNIITFLLHGGVCEMLVWGTASWLCTQQYVWLAGQLRTGNCILNLDKSILICGGRQWKRKIKEMNNKKKLNKLFIMSIRHSGLC